MEPQSQKAFRRFDHIERKTVEKRLSPTAVSNLFTMGVTATVDPRQALPEPYTVPPFETCKLRARLILEEALETIAALGVGVNVPYVSNGKPDAITLRFDNLDFFPMGEPNLEEIIDGCCDLHYVEVGTLCACGVPDVPHMNIVNYANDAKFPGGKAVINPETGKFGKPPGWKAPNHETVRRETLLHMLFNYLSPQMVANAAQVDSYDGDDEEDDM